MLILTEVIQAFVNEFIRSFYIILLIEESKLEIYI